MMLRRKQQQRRGSTLLESALVYPVLFLIVLGIIFLGIAVFRYEQVSHIAREGTRWAAVHGALYKQEQGRPSLTTVSDVYTNSIQPQAASMQLSGLSYSVYWNANDGGTDDDQRRSRSVTSGGVVVSRANTVTVTVTYSWNTGLFGTIPVSSSSTMPMSY